MSGSSAPQNTPKTPQPQPTRSVGEGDRPETVKAGVADHPALDAEFAEAVDFVAKTPHQHPEVAAYINQAVDKLNAVRDKVRGRV